MTEDKTLEPCPWCGRHPNVELWHGGAPTRHRISCPMDYECAANPSVMGETHDEAAKAWNTRHRGY